MVGIKGWEMPERCSECRCKDWLLGSNDRKRYYCMVSGRAKFIGYEIDIPRPDFCPLVEVPDWHDVNNLLPLVGKLVLICDADTDVHMGWLSRDGVWETDEYTLDNVTHWQDIMLPEK